MVRRCTRRWALAKLCLALVSGRGVWSWCLALVPGPAVWPWCQVISSGHRTQSTKLSLAIPKARGEQPKGSCVKGA